MKITLILLILIIFILIGLYVYYKYAIRYWFYTDLIYICKSLHNNINFQKSDIDTIFLNINNNLKFSTKFIINRLNNIQCNFLKSDEKEMANKFFQSLGYGDVDYEISNIKYYSNYFKETKDVAYDDLRKKGLTYLKVNIAMGIALSIIFI